MSTFSATRPEFLEPYLIVPPNSPINKERRRKPVLIKREELQREEANQQYREKLLCKRKYNRAFNKESYEDERYGQHIDSDYFEKGNIGHGVFQKETEVQTEEEELDAELKQKLNDTYEWCLQYLKSKEKIIT
jgi:hypothetical protein